MSGVAASTLLGGIGLFLLGMNLMTDSLTAFGGSALRRLVKTLTRRRFYGVLTGAAVTATVQSSSATTLVTVGFVSAGLLTFGESLGLILGANVGTTSTAWIVSLVGLKVQVSTVALPMVGIGALVRLVTHGRRARLGLAMSGFGLVFVGIDVMQAGMASLDVDLTPRAEGAGLLTTLTLVGAGILMTVIMQSSSAAVATTLVALHAGSITLHQAAALVIGQNVGTTVTAILGAVGGNLAARRTAVAHTTFNVVTGLVALSLLGPFLWSVEHLGSRFIDDSPETTVAIFHTAFNLLGVMLFFPLAPRLAQLVERLVPQRGGPAVQRLSKGALQIPAVALEAARRSTADVALDTFDLSLESLRAAAGSDAAGRSWREALGIIADPREWIRIGSSGTSGDLAKRLRDVRSATGSIAEYLASIRTSSQPAGVRDEHVELLHAVEDLQRLLSVIARDHELDVIQEDSALRRLAAVLVSDLEQARAAVADETDDRADHLAVALARVAHAEKERRDAYRAITLARLADGDTEPSDVDRRVHAARWMGKIPRLAERTFRHVGSTARLRSPLGAADDPDDVDEDDERG